MTGPPGAAPEVSLVVPIGPRFGDLGRVYAAYAAELEKLGKAFEFIFVIDGGRAHLLDGLRSLKAAHGDRVRVLVLGRTFGESAALAVGFERARGEVIVTLAPYFQVEAGGLSSALAVLEDEGVDLVVGRRYPRRGSALNRLQSVLFHWVVKRVTATDFHDITGGFRVMRRGVAAGLELYGELHRFIPIIALDRGFSVREVKLRQHPDDRPKRLYGPAVYLRRLLDLMTVFFLVRFTRRPLRFFGSIGLAVFGAGSIITLYLGLYRLLGVGGIADRPLLLLGVLLMVLGVQSISIGLLGEIIIFTHASRIKQYHVAEVI